MIDGTIWLEERPKPKELTRFRPVQIMQRKYDGRRLTIVKKSNGRIHAWCRELTDDNDHWPTIGHRFPGVLDLPPGTALDGEVYPEGAPASDAISAIVEDWDTLRFVPFAVPFLAGDDLREVPLNLGLDVLFEICRTHGFTEPESHHCGFFTPDNWQEQKDRLLAEAERRRIEGWVLKNATYDEWWKIKPVKTVDAVVTGFQGGKGKYTGMMGALLVSVYNGQGELVEIARVGGGWNDKDRASISPSKALGRVMEVTYQSVQRDRLQFPRFFRWREDKPAETCTLDQLSKEQ